MTIFETDRLIAREWELEDAEEAFRIYSDPEVSRFLGGPLESVDAQRDRIAWIIERNRNLKEGLGSWPLIEKATGEMVGVVLLKPLPNSEQIEVGWHLRRSAWGKGFATEAGKAAIQRGFERVHLPVILAVVNPENHASRRVTERLGMRYEGRTSEYYDTELDWFTIVKPNQAILEALDDIKRM